MYNAVLDTNIFVSSIFWELGNPHKIVELALDKKIKVFTSVKILQELEKVLRRDFNEPDEMIHRQISLILAYASLVRIINRVNVIKDDPEDNKILECAISCNADFVVTGDNHLLDLKEYHGVKIISAKELIEVIKNN